MKNHPCTSRRLNLSLVLLSVSLLCGASALRAQNTWLGGGVNDNWTTPGNFSTSPPLGGDDLHFAGSTQTTNNNDSGPAFTPNSLTFDAGAASFVLEGDPLYFHANSLANAITNNSTNLQTLAFTQNGPYGTLTIDNGNGSAPVFTINAASGDLLVSGNIALYNFSSITPPLELTFDGAYNTTVTGPITDGALPSELVKNGTGALTLEGANTYGGDTTVNAGLLRLDGSITSPDTFINPAGTLGGVGTAGGNVTNSGFVAPGDIAPGTLTVSGAYTQNSNGTLTIRLGSAGQSDLLAVGGATSLNGTAQFVRLNNTVLQPGEQFTFLTSTGALSGKFSNVQTDFGTILGASVIYNPNSAVVEITQGSFAAFAAKQGLTPNQSSVAFNLDTAAGDPRAAGLINFLDGEPLGNLPYDFDLIAPEELTSIFQISEAFADVQANNIETHLAGDRAEIAPTDNTAVGLMVRDDKNAVEPKDEGKTASMPAPEADRWNLWAEGSGDWVRVDGDGNGSGYDFSTGGVTLGADYRVCDHFVAGLMGGYGNTGATLTQGGSVDVESGRLGIYSTIFGNGFYLNTLAEGGYNSYDTHRLGLGGIAQGNTDGAEFDGLIGGGYELHQDNFTLGPVASVQYTYMGIDSFAENGSLAPLNFPSQNQDSLRSKVGFRIAYDSKLKSGIVVTPSVTAQWQHEYLDTSYALDSQFASGAGGIFTVRGPELGRDSVVVNAGVNVQWTQRLGTYIYYYGELGRMNYQLNSVTAGVKIGF